MQFESIYCIQRAKPNAKIFRHLCWDTPSLWLVQPQTSLFWKAINSYFGGKKTPCLCTFSCQYSKMRWFFCPKVFQLLLYIVIKRSFFVEPVTACDGWTGRNQHNRPVYISPSLKPQLFESMCTVWRKPINRHNCRRKTIGDIYLKIKFRIVDDLRRVSDLIRTGQRWLVLFFLLSGFLPYYRGYQLFIRLSSTAAASSPWAFHVWNKG